jgi:hypothetical protein
MKLDPGMHIVMHLVFFGKSGVIASKTILIPEVEENLERITSERLQGINTKTHLPIKNSEFEKLLLKFNH